MASQQQIGSEVEFINPELVKRWEAVRNTQTKNGTPKPVQEGVSRCPDCMKPIEAGIVKEYIDKTDKEHPVKRHLLWVCSCGYVYAGLEGLVWHPTSFKEWLIGLLKVLKGARKRGKDVR